jgi:NTP pyrophosphatase (non-canonical NTP hydrolase)
MKKDKKSLTFKKFHETNVARSKADIKHSNKWIPLSWAGALCGECGELANFCKKMARGDKIKKEDLAYEIADILTYLSLISDQLNIDMEEAIIEKFNIVSDRWGSKYKL